jgi:hypothetical protein
MPAYKAIANSGPASTIGAAVRIFDRAPAGERRWLLWPLNLLLTIALFATVTLAAQGCSTITSSVKSLWSSDDDTSDDAADDSAGEPLPPPVANVAVTYKRPGDALTRATVIKFFGADVIANHQRDPAHLESTVRFDGGVPIWEFKADESTFGSITGVGAAKYSVKSIEYSKVPTHFTQVIPEEGPPEPLDRGAYYVFQIDRQSGSTSYQAVKVLADGSLQAYNAQPRAGNSYLLCCNITSEFPEPVVLPEPNPDAQTENAPADQPPDEPSAPQLSAPPPDSPYSGAGQPPSAPSAEPPPADTTPGDSPDSGLGVP